MDIPNIHSKIDSAAAGAKKGATALGDQATEIGLAMQHAAETAGDGAEAAAGKTKEAMESAAQDAKRSARGLAKKAKQAVHQATDAEPEAR